MVKIKKTSTDFKLKKQFLRLETEIARFRVNLTKECDKNKFYSDLSKVLSALKALNDNIENPKKEKKKKPVKVIKKTKPIKKIGVTKLLKNIDKDL